MAFAVPASLSPSKVESFMTCPLAFRFSAIDHIPEAPSVPATKGTLVHRALELLFCQPAADRSLAAALDALDQAVGELQASPDWPMLALEPVDEATFVDDAELLVRRYFELEDPTKVRDIGLELRLEVALDDCGNGTGPPTVLRGIIDRLELDDDGELVVTDYKTGRAPGESYEQRRLGGVHFYAYLCERVFGRRPSRIQLLYLGDPCAIIARPSEQSIRFLPKKAGALLRAVERACEIGDFRPRQGPLCAYCGFKQWCPEFGGDPERAAIEAPAAVGLAVAASPAA